MGSMDAMHHLDETQLVDALDGHLGPEEETHLASCDSCRIRVAGLRDVLRRVADADVPEPSPVFWDYFPARVSAALDTPARIPWFQPLAVRWAWGGAMAALLVAVALFWIPSRVTNSDRAVSVATTTGADRATVIQTPTPEPLVPEASEPGDDDLEQDAAWALVRSVADGLDYEDVREFGVAPRAGAIEAAAMALTATERAELARIIAGELKRSGA